MICRWNRMLFLPYEKDFAFDNVVSLDLYDAGRCAVRHAGQLSGRAAAFRHGEPVAVACGSDPRIGCDVRRGA